MSAQDIFDYVVEHLREQGKKSIGFETGCAYRGPEGLKCAVGCLLSDAEYDPSMEGTNISGLMAHGKFPQLDHLKAHGQLLAKLQRVHDMCAIPRWEESFRTIADEMRLIYTPLQQEQEQ